MIRFEKDRLVKHFLEKITIEINVSTIFLMRNCNEKSNNTYCKFISVIHIGKNLIENRWRNK